MSEGQTDAGGPRLDRRTALKLGVGLGVAAWAAPAVQLLNVSSASAQTTSGGGGGGGGGNGFPSHVELIVKRAADGKTYGVKYDEFDNPRWDRIGTPAMCAGKGNFTNPTAPVLTAFRATTVTGSYVNGKGTYRLTLPAGYTYLQGWAKCGMNCIVGVPVAGKPGTYDFACS